MISETLGDDAGGKRVAQEDSARPPSETTSSWKRAPPEITKPDDRRAGPRRKVHHVARLLSVRLGQRATEHGEVLAAHEDEPTVDGPVSRDDAVVQNALFVGAEIPRAVGNECIELHERVGIKQDCQVVRGPSACLARADGRSALPPPKQLKSRNARSCPTRAPIARLSSLARVRAPSGVFVQRRSRYRSAHPRRTGRRRCRGRGSRTQPPRLIHRFGEQVLFSVDKCVGRVILDVTLSRVPTRR